MTRHYKDWIIGITVIVHPHFGMGYRATAYVPKDDGTKACIREFARYDGLKNKTQMLEYTQKLLEI